MTVSWAQLGSLLDLSERSIREHRAQGHVVRSGSGYDVRRSVLGMLDWLRVEAAKKGLGEAGEPLWKSYEVVLAHRRELLEEVRRLRAAFIAKSKQGRERPE